MDFCFGGAENIPWSVCQNILLSVLNALSSLRVEYRSVLYYFSTLLSVCKHNTHTGTPRPFVSVSNLRTHISRRRFHLRRPTVFLLDDTVAPTDKLQHQDISDISKNLTFMGLVFLSHFAWNLFSFQCPCITPDACQKKLEVLSELFRDFKKSRS